VNTTQPTFMQCWRQCLAARKVRSLCDAYVASSSELTVVEFLPKLGKALAWTTDQPAKLFAAHGACVARKCVADVRAMGGEAKVGRRIGTAWLWIALRACMEQARQEPHTLLVFSKLALVALDRTDTRKLLNAVVFLARKDGLCAPPVPPVWLGVLILKGLGEEAFSTWEWEPRAIAFLQDKPNVAAAVCLPLVKKNRQDKRHLCAAFADVFKKTLPHAPNLDLLEVAVHSSFVLVKVLGPLLVANMCPCPAFTDMVVPRILRAGIVGWSVPVGLPPLMGMWQGWTWQHVGLLHQWDRVRMTDRMNMPHLDVQRLFAAMLTTIIGKVASEKDKARLSCLALYGFMETLWRFGISEDLVPHLLRAFHAEDFHDEDGYDQGYPSAPDPNPGMPVLTGAKLASVRSVLFYACMRNHACATSEDMFRLLFRAYLHDEYLRHKVDHMDMAEARPELVGVEFQAVCWAWSLCSDRYLFVLWLKFVHKWARRAWVALNSTKELWRFHMYRAACAAPASISEKRILTLFAIHCGYIYVDLQPVLEQLDPNTCRWAWIRALML
jgi:hypothetical protein